MLEAVYMTGKFTRSITINSNTLKTDKQSGTETWHFRRKYVPKVCNTAKHASLTRFPVDYSTIKP